jgi:type IV secretion system protein VirB6
MRMVIAVGAAYAAQVGVAMMTPGGSSTGISTLAMQQGGLGMILTVLLVMTPPMAAAFFNGVLGQFAAYSAFGTVGARGGRDSAGRTPQQPGYQFDPPQANQQRTDPRNQSAGSFSETPMNEYRTPTRG